jgi:hypothetical protein
MEQFEEQLRRLSASIFALAAIMALAACGKRLERLLDMPLDKMAADIQQKGKPVAGANGNFRLELCLSDDHQFCGLQLFRFGDFQYKPVFEPRFYEGKDVESITQLV